jgi:hypothetical protein
VRNPEGKTPLRRHRNRCEDNIKIYFREIEQIGMDWIHLAQDRGQKGDPVNKVMKLRVL